MSSESDNGLLSWITDQEVQAVRLEKFLYNVKQWSKSEFVREPEKEAWQQNTMLMELFRIHCRFLWGKDNSKVQQISQLIDEYRRDWVEGHRRWETLKKQGKLTPKEVHKWTWSLHFQLRLQQQSIIERISSTLQQLVRTTPLGQFIKTDADWQQFLVHILAEQDELEEKVMSETMRDFNASVSSDEQLKAIHELETFGTTVPLTSARELDMSKLVKSEIDNHVHELQHWIDSISPRKWVAQQDHARVMHGRSRVVHDPTQSEAQVEFEPMWKPGQHKTFGNGLSSRFPPAPAQEEEERMQSTAEAAHGPLHSHQSAEAWRSWRELGQTALGVGKGVLRAINPFKSRVNGSAWLTVLNGFVNISNVTLALSNLYMLTAMGGSPGNSPHMDTIINTEKMWGMSENQWMTQTLAWIQVVQAITVYINGSLKEVLVDVFQRCSTLMENTEGWHPEDHTRILFMKLQRQYTARARANGLLTSCKALVGIGGFTYFYFLLHLWGLPVIKMEGPGPLVCMKLYDLEALAFVGENIQENLVARFAAQASTV